MKKLIIILLAVLTLSSCSQTISGDAKVSQENEKVYFKYDGKNYTNNDAFQKLKAQTVNTYFDYLIAYKALEVEGISLDDSIEDYKKDLEEQYQLTVEAYGEELVKLYYGDKESYIQQSLESKELPLVLSYSKYQENYAMDKIDYYITTYPTIYVEYVSSTSKSKMNTFLKNVKKSKDFANAFEKTKFEENETVFSDILDLNNTTLPNEVLDSFDTLKIGAISKLIEIDNGDDSYTYYVVRVLGKDAKNEYPQEFIDYLINNSYIPTPTEIANEKHEISVYDDDFNNTYKLIIPDNESE